MGSQRIVIGTAGHVDHGKTALVRALTGIDTDRLKEEKRRGITLELGFAHLALPGGAEAGLVDVPGHERFVRAMVAGAGGIDLVLLVVAADEGVMPQTREHIDICRLLGVRAGVIALTKSDLLPGLGPEFRAALDADVAAAVAGSFLAGAPVVPVSARTGDGLDALKAALAQAARAAPERPAEGPAYLPLDRAFTLKGFGTVVTGTLLSGSLRAGDDAELVPGGSGPLRIRSLQVHGHDTPRALAGQRTAVNLSGVEVDAVSRGMVLTTPGALVASPMLDVAIEVLSAAERPLRARTKLLCHLGTGVAPCTVALLDRQELGPGEQAFAQLRLLHPLPALPGQRFILRGFRALPGRGQTVAGGSVLAVVPKKRRRGAHATEGLALLSKGSLEERIAWLLEDAGPAGLAADALPQRTAASPEAVAAVLEQLSARGAALLFDRDRRAYLGGRCFQSLVAAAAGEVAEHHRRNPLTPSMPKEELRQRIAPGMPGLDGRLFQKVLQQLGASGQAVVEGEGVRSPGHAHEVRSADQGLRSQLAGLLRVGGLSPPTPAEIALRLGLEEGRVVAVLKLLAGEGSAVRVKDDLYFETGTIEGLKQRLLGHLQAKGAITTPEFKELTGATRKFTIPLAEFFDQQKLTLRLGEKRVLRGDGRAGVAR